MNEFSEDPFDSNDISTIRSYSGLASTFWSKIFSGLTATAYRERGEVFVNELWYAVLTAHQDDKYVEGLRKLGIGDDPPAVAAAKYHYFTNIIGGLDMEYIEETRKKVWIRYRSPMWTYAGTALLAMPASVRRTIFSAWHPRNGELMGAPQLGYVGTKFVMEGDAYDEGYFCEFDVPLRPEQRMGYKVVRHTPEFDSSIAPSLDSVLWPEARVLKARPKFSSHYARTTVDCLYARLGEFQTHHIVASTMRMLAVQYLPEWLSRTGVDDTSVKGIAAFNCELLKASRRSYNLVEEGDSLRIQVRNSNPFDESYPRELLEAFFEFQRMSARLINSHVRATWSANDAGEEWVFEDTGRWLW